MCSFIITPDSSKIIDSENFKAAEKFIWRLIMSDIDSEHGVKVTVDAPTGNDPMLSITRPLVIRQEYGKSLNTHSNSSMYVDRYFYGQINNKSGYSQVGTLPQDQYTRQMTEDMQQLGRELISIVKNSERLKQIDSQKLRSYSNLIFKEPNHLSILIYFGLKGHKEVSTMSYHCDNTYSPNGKFSKTMNTQLEDTPTITLTIGNSRKIMYQRRYADDKGKWQIDPSFNHSEILSHGTICIVHPDDERPFSMEIGGKSRKCQYQHGNLRVSQNKMSIAFVFRHVTTHCKFYNQTNNRVFESPPTAKDTLDHNILHKKARKEDFQKKLQSLYQSIFDSN